MKSFVGLMAVCSLCLLCAACSESADAPRLSQEPGVGEVEEGGSSSEGDDRGEETSASEQAASMVEVDNTEAFEDRDEEDVEPGGDDGVADDGGSESGTGGDGAGDQDDEREDDITSDCRNPSSLPFRMDEGLSVAGYGLNTNDNGVQDYGELAVDCGGAGQTACLDVELDVVIDSTTLLNEDLYGGYRIWFREGTINGRRFEMVLPEPGQAGFTDEDVGLVVEHPSRLGVPHASPTPYRLSLMPQQFNGAVSIAMEGVTGGHPYTFSAQEAVLASRYLREVLERDIVVVTGGSYGAAAAMIDAALYPEHFDGVVAVAAPYNGRQFLNWTEVNLLRSIGANFSPIESLYYSGLDSMSMAAAQAGLTLENLDLTKPGNATVMTTLILGETDGVWLPSGFVDAEMARMEAQGIDWVTIMVADEEGHGGPQMNQLMIEASRTMYEAIREKKAAGWSPAPAECAKIRQVDTSYDDILRARPETQETPWVTALWSDVSQFERHDGSHSVAVLDEAIFTGSVQGSVTRRDIADDGSARTRWQTPVGRLVDTIAAADDVIVVGSLRGMAVLDAETGRVVREMLDVGRVHDLIIADVIEEVPGLEVVARVDQDRLYVESLAGGEVLSDSTIGVGGGMMFDDVLGDPLLFVPLQRGHVAGFHFIPDEVGNGWVPEATWISEYLALDVRALALAERGGRPVLVATGHAYGEPVSVSPAPGFNAGGVKVIDVSGLIVDELPTRAYKNDRITSFGEGRLMISGNGFAQLVDIEARTFMVWPDETVRGAASYALEIADRWLVLMWSHGARPSLTIRDMTGAVIHKEQGRSISPAMDLFANPEDGEVELSVLSRSAGGAQDWEIERFSLRSGQPLGTPILYPAGTPRTPKRLVRNGAAAEAASYQPFLNDGDLYLDTFRVATLCGRWYAAASIFHEQGYHLAQFTAEAPNCALEWASSGQPQNINFPSPGLVIASEQLGSSAPSGGPQQGALRFVSISGPDSHFVMTTSGGRVALFDSESSIREGMSEEVTPTAVAEIAGHVTSLAVSESGENPLIAVGSWLAAEDGATVHIVDPESLTVLNAFDAGHVLGIAFVDLDRNGEVDVLVGTQGGDLSGYTQTGRRLFRWSAGDLHLGENGALLVEEGEDGVLVAFAVTGGFRVVEISPP